MCKPRLIYDDTCPVVRWVRELNRAQINFKNMRSEGYNRLQYPCYIVGTVFYVKN